MTDTQCPILSRDDHFQLETAQSLKAHRELGVLLNIPCDMADTKCPILSREDHSQSGTARSVQAHRERLESANFRDPWGSHPHLYSTQ